MTRFLVHTLIVALALAGVTPAFAAKVLNRGNGAEPYSIDPHRAISTAENNVIGDMFIGLYTEDAAGKPELGAAQSVETSKDGLTWTFKLRPHNWSDGTPVTAEDFVFAFRRVLDQKTAAEYASVLYPIKNALAVNEGKMPVEKLGVSAPDAATVVITLEHPAPFLPELLTHYTCYPLPKAVVEKYGNDWTRGEHMVVNGPYMLKGWRPHDRIHLVRNPKFYDAANVKIDEVFYYPTDDDNAALKRYRAGELDTQERWPIAEWKWLQANIPSETKRVTQLAVYFVSFNLTRKPFDDIRVRKALALAIDNDALVNDVYQGVYGDAAVNFIPAGTANVDASAKVEWAGVPIAERREEAKKLLAAAGFGPSNPLTFTYRYISIPDVKRSAIALQAMWNAIGVKVQLSAGEAKVHWKLLEQHDFDVTYNTWAFDYNDAKNILFQYLSTSGQMNNSDYKSPAFDALMAKADAEPDAVKRGEYLGQANAMLVTDLPSAPLYHPYVRHLVKPYVVNWTDNVRDTNRTRWLDIDEKMVKRAQDEAAGSEGGFWSWLGSWFSAEAWSKWWNS